MTSLKEVHDTLFAAYGPQGWWPINGRYNPEFKFRRKTPEERFEISVGAILTQNTSWKNVEKTLVELKKQNLFSQESIVDAPHEELARAVRSSGYHNQKARKLKEFVQAKKGEEPTRKELLAVWGIGPETADSILLYAYDVPVFVIDAYTKRVFSRLGIIDKPKEKISYEEVQELFHQSLPKDNTLYNEYHALIVEHAKRFCRTKPECDDCPLKTMCKYYKSKLFK